MHSFRKCKGGLTMEDMEPAVTQESIAEVKTQSSHWYDGHISLEDAKTFIKSNITTAARSFIAIGFYLKCVRDRELFKEEEYEAVWDFAKAEYGISKSTASRYMSMNDRFSENGNSPNIREEYRAFGKSQLQEMLYLEEDQLEQVKPEDRVEDIRSLRKPREVPYIELPGQMDFEMVFPGVLLSDYLEAPVTDQKQTFEMNVEDMLLSDGQEGIAISQQEPVSDGGVVNPSSEELEEKRKENWLIRCGVLKEMCDALCDMNAYGLENGRYSMTAIQNISSRTAYGFGFGDDGSGHLRYDADCKNSQYHVEEFSGDGKWIFESGEVDQHIWNFNGREWHMSHPEEQNQERSTFNSEPTPCLYREGYSCTLSEEKKMVPGDGHSCGLTCCWSCKFHGMCKMECNASAGRDGELPEYDASWFVKEWAGRVPEELERALKVCRENSNNADRAKAVQKEISPYGAHSRSCWEYDFSFHGFAGGMDFRIGKVDIHLKYGRFVQELMNLYPDFEEPENVPEQSESVQESSETVIDGEYVEISPEPEPVEPTQPELPILKNNEQRAAFVKAYETWPIWIDQKETGERYYRYELSDKVSMVVKVSWKHSWKSYKESKDYEYGAEQYYLLGINYEWHNGKNTCKEDETRTFYECSTNRAALVEYLKEFQKKKYSWGWR
jgi:hypothetical protein